MTVEAEQEKDAHTQLRDDGEIMQMSETRLALLSLLSWGKWQEQWLEYSLTRNASREKILAEKCFVC